MSAINTCYDRTSRKEDEDFLDDINGSFTIDIPFYEEKYNPYS